MSHQNPKTIKVYLTKEVHKRITGYVASRKQDMDSAVLDIINFMTYQIEEGELSVQEIVMTTGIDTKSKESIVKGVLSFAAYNYLGVDGKLTNEAFADYLAKQFVQMLKCTLSQLWNK